MLMFSRFFIFCSVCVAPFTALAFSLQQYLTTSVESTIPTVRSNSRINYLDIAQEIQFWIFVFVGIIAVTYIIYIGAKLLWAPGNTEEMTSALKSMVYVIL